MKSIFFKILIVVNLFLIYSCKSQTVTDYITFYNNISPKLNTIAVQKNQFYGQNFSVFYNELSSKNIDVVILDCEPKTDPGTQYYVLKLYFFSRSMWSLASRNSFRYPKVQITFENAIPDQIKRMIQQSGSQWNPDFVQFFANMKIEKIDFVGINGYNSHDRSLK